MSQTEPREIADIKRQLIELEPLRDLPNTGRNFVDIVDWISIPPAYILKLLFFPILQFTDFGREDKVTWSTFFSYKGLCFKIRDFKFETWAIEGDISQPTAKELALQIRSKIEKACKKLDLILNPFLKGEIDRGNFFLYNEYSTLNQIYSFYHDKVSETLSDQKKFQGESTTPSGERLADDLATFFNKSAQLEQTISSYCFALILSFFSLQEFLFGVFHAFQNDGKGLVEFMKDGKWQEKFKAVIDISKDNEINKIYARLLRIRMDYRNPLTHGLTGEHSLLVAVPRFGLMPLSFEFLSQSPHYGAVPIQSENAPEIVSTLESFLEYIFNNDPYKFYMKYVSSGFTIPATQAELARIKNKMSDHGTFEEYLEDRSRYEGMVINREI